MSRKKESGQQMLNRIGKDLAEGIKTLDEMINCQNGMIVTFDGMLDLNPIIQRKLDRILYESQQELVQLSNIGPESPKWMYSTVAKQGSDGEVEDF